MIKSDPFAPELQRHAYGGIVIGGRPSSGFCNALRPQKINAMEFMSADFKLLC
jgi:hypothetical protein